MTVRAMKVESRKKHPHADVLWVYLFEARGNTVQVVANEENVYEEGDVVAVARIGDRLKDGTLIERMSLRGIPSRGMALGKVDAEVGTDLTDQFAIRPKRVPVVKWTSIEGFHNLYGELKAAGEHHTCPPVTFRAKIKLHGTNGVVQVLPDGRVVSQGRTQVHLDEYDGYGFRRWVESVEDKFKTVETTDVPTVFFGEWCGLGVQKGVALSQLDRKIFVVFAARKDDRTIIDPDELRALTPEDPDIFVLPWFGKEVTIDFGDKALLREEVAKLNQVVAEVEAEDPWVKETFGVSGTGEGLVYYPVSDIPRAYDVTDFLFKTKGAKHKVVKQKEPVQIDPEVAKSIEDFVDMFVTEGRLEQAVQTVFGTDVPTIKGTGPFLKALAQDVHKESAAELEASGLTWKQVAKGVTTAARQWFLAKMQEI